MESNGPGVRIKGTPQQVSERYEALAAEADPVLAENYAQHAEHYRRMMTEGSMGQ